MCKLLGEGSVSPFVGKMQYHIKNSNQFVKEVREIMLDTNEMCSYDVSMLFMSILMYKVLEMIRVKLEEDNTLRERESTPLALDGSICQTLLGLCCNGTYFLFQGEYQGKSTISRFMILPWDSPPTSIHPTHLSDFWCPRDKVEKGKAVGTVYHIQCGDRNVLYIRD